MQALRKPKQTYRLLSLLQALIGIGALPAGFALITDPSGASLGMPLEWLDGSPFPSFLIPGLFLFFVNGVAQVIAAVLSWRQHRLAGLFGIGLGTLLIGWIIIQMMIVDFSWLQPTYLAFGAIESWLGWVLYRHGQQA